MPPRVDFYEGYQWPGKTRQVARFGVFQHNRSEPEMRLRFKPLFAAGSRLWRAGEYSPSFYLLITANNRPLLDQGIPAVWGRLLDR